MFVVIYSIMPGSPVSSQTDSFIFLLIGDIYSLLNPQSYLLSALAPNSNSQDILAKGILPMLIQPSI